jgi:hypothetical protein
VTDAYLHPRLEGDDEVAKLVAVAVAQGASLEIALALVNTGFIAGHRAGKAWSPEKQLALRLEVERNGRNGRRSD